MAITIETTPANYLPATNPVVWEFSSTNYTQTAFSFYVELTINGSVHSYHDIYPEVTGRGKFMCDEILRSYVNSTLNTTGSLVVPYDNAVASYSIRVREKYGTPPSLQGSWTAGSTRYAFNGALRHQDWINYDYTNYDATTSSATTAQWLTSFPSGQNYFCGLSESCFASILCTDTSMNLLVKLYDVTGSLINSATATVTLPTYDYILFDISPTSIYTNTTISVGDFNTCYYYTIQADATGGGGNSGLSELFTVYLDTECSQYTSRRLIWLDKLGSFESYSFTKYSEESTSVTFNKYQRNPGRWNASNEWSYNRQNGANFIQSKQTKDTLLVNSDWIKEAKQNWLVQSLLESPLVYLEISYGVYEPVTVQSSSFKKKQRIKERLIQEQFTVERTYNYNSQLN